jgi:5-methylcytosine-specific restriction enzyme subunit McrC
MEFRTIREFGLIFPERTAEAVSSSIDRCVIGNKAFDALAELALGRQSSDETDFLKLSSNRGNNCVQVKNYVGVFEFAGFQIEVLPKTTTDTDDPVRARKILWRMLSSVHAVSPLEADQASLETLRDSWLESMIRLVLVAISQLVRRGLKREYTRVEDESNFLRGQLNLSAQVRQRPGRQHYFNIRFDQYLLDRAENRLLKSALVRLSRWTRNFENTRLCRELLFAFHDVQESGDVATDLSSWSIDRSMIHYQSLLPWIKLILRNETPAFAKGENIGISLLFPMEKLFEEYVAIRVKRQLQPGYFLKSQAASKYLVEEHNSKPMFQLRPDLAITKNKQPIAILDTKWKLIDQTKGSTKDKYDLKQSDFYQLFAYGEKYLGGRGDLFLIYPKHERFEDTLPLFHFNEMSRLWVLPFDLELGVVDFNGCSPTPEYLVKSKMD